MSYTSTQLKTRIKSVLLTKTSTQVNKTISVNFFTKPWSSNSPVHTPCSLHTQN